MSFSQETARRRTFAIISHPDAGKTTITEKLLLFGGAIQLAGTVKGRNSARYATFDWVENTARWTHGHFTVVHGRSPRLWLRKHEHGFLGVARLHGTGSRNRVCQTLAVMTRAHRRVGLAGVTEGFARPRF